MKLEKFLNEERLIKSMDINIIFKYSLKPKSVDVVKNFIKKEILKKIGGVKIDIDTKYE